MAAGVKTSINATGIAHVDGVIQQIVVSAELAQPDKSLEQLILNKTGATPDVVQLNLYLLQRIKTATRTWTLVLQNAMVSWCRSSNP